MIVDSLNNLSEGEQEPTARAWVDILELEASHLIQDANESNLCMHNYNSSMHELNSDLSMQGCDISVDKSAQYARNLGLMEARLSVVVADQIVAAVLRGYLSEVEAP